MLTPLKAIVIGSLWLCPTKLGWSQSTQPFSTAADQPAIYTLLKGISYSHPGDVDLVADLYVPKGTGPFPGIVFIHGGGWSSGDRTQLRRQASYMAERGMVGMTIEYRLAPAHNYPAAVEDAEAAVTWLKAHSSDYRIDATHIGVVGSSAGGYLAAMVGLEGGRHNVQAVVVLNGIFDLASMPTGNMVSDFLGKSCEAAPKLCDDASPVHHVKAGAPPFLVMHGTADQTAPYAQAKGFVEKASAAGGNAELYTVVGGPHTFWSKPAWKDISDEKMSAFLNMNLRR